MKGEKEKDGLGFDPRGLWSLISSPICKLGVC